MVFSTGSGYPSVNSIQRSNPNPTNAPTVNFTVTFSQPVTGVDVSDFALATTGISGANINSVNPVSGPSEVYTVNVNTGTGSGTIGLNLFDNDSIKNSQNSPLGGPVAENGNFTGEAYTVDKTLPVVYSSEATPDSINLITVKFTVKFFENVTGVTSDDFSLTTTGISGASISNVTGSGDTYTVIVNPGTGNGTIRLDVVDDDSIKDNVGNPLDGNFTGASFPINKTIESYIAGNPVGAYFLSTLQALRDTYAEDDGPLKVVSTNGMPIIAALRDAWLVNGQTTSFAQLMGLPQEQLSDTYYFPAYNNVTLSEQIRFANVDTVPTTVTVTIAGVVRGTYPLNPNEGRREIYALDTGPVEVKSSNGAKIIAAIRSAWLINGQTTSFAQLMGLPKEALSTTYWFPAYNNVTLSGQLRLAVP